MLGKGLKAMVKRRWNYARSIIASTTLIYQSLNIQIVLWPTVPNYLIEFSSWNYVNHLVRVIKEDIFWKNHIKKRENFKLYLVYPFYCAHIWRHTEHSSYHHGKSNWQLEFRSWTRLFMFYFLLMPLRKV